MEKKWKYPATRINRRINISKKILEKLLKIKTAAMENVEVFRLMKAIYDGSSILHRGILLLLNFNQETMEVINAYGPVFGVAVE